MTDQTTAPDVAIDSQAIAQTHDTTTQEAAAPAAAPAPKEQEGAYAEVVPSPRASVASQEELDAVIKLHNDWKESVLHPRRKIQGGRANLSQLSLKGLSFVGVDISGANLSAADLSNTNFSGSILNAVNFENANLSGADFRGAKLTNAKFRGALIADTMFDDGVTIPDAILPEVEVAEEAPAEPQA